VGDIFGCKQKIIFGRVRRVQMITGFGISGGCGGVAKGAKGANDHGFWNIQGLWGCCEVYGTSGRFAPGTAAIRQVMGSV